MLHKKQALILMFIGLNLFIYYYSQGSFTYENIFFRFMGPFVYFFLNISSVILYGSMFNTFLRKKSSNLQKTIFDNNLIVMFASSAFFSGLLIFLFWDTGRMISLPNLFSNVNEVSILILILYCLLIQFPAPKGFARNIKGIRLIYLLVILMTFHRIDDLFFNDYKDLSVLVGGIFYLVSPILLFGNLIYLPATLHEIKNIESVDLQKTAHKVQEIIAPKALKGVTSETIKMIGSKLLELMEIERIYYDEDVRMPDVAEAIGISPHLLSAFINHYLGTNFNHLINSYRIKEAIILLRDEPRRTALSIGYAVGFNSNSTFLRCFHYVTGMTPSAFREEIMRDKKADIPFIDPFPALLHFKCQNILT
ncbi:helix-turn-helix domain-containing protein [Leptospira sp. FAT2]|uniref:AraC family transcriptional regulator n=1 Tax=Leptospira sanjuanensis TaxID=2879643 RepID=UPI001EE82C9B|nr:helix-turn-helix domain-containing protein [Leptospira sanjuanensis]MCG6192323.1 helix-turn-helix domain-containing protein [Leptospira sanjuanensis]